jgi:hypothetical protein
MDQLIAETLHDLIYTPEKKKIWDREMNKAGKKWEDGTITFEAYMALRRRLRTRLGYPA